MAQSRQKFAFARCGASVALAATLSLSMVPATALAEVGSDAQGGAVATAANTATTPEGYTVEIGKSYPVTVGFKKTGTDQTSMPQTMGFLGTQGSVVYDGTQWRITVNATAKGASFISSMTIGSQTSEGASNSDGTKSFTFTVASLNRTAISFLVSMGGGDPSPTEADLVFEVSADDFETAAPEPAPEPDPDPEPEPDPDPDPDPAPEPGEDDAIVEGKEYDAPMSWAQYGQMAGGFMESTATVVYQSGQYTVKLPVTSVGAAATGFALTYNGTKYTVQDGAFVLTFAELPKSIQVTLTSDKMPFPITDTITFDLSAIPGADDGGGSEEVTVNKDALKAAIDEAKGLIEKGDKTEAARQKLQTAITQAEADYNNVNIQQSDVDAATSALEAAIEEFKNSEDVQTPSDQYGMEVGKTYTASVSYEGTGAFANLNDMLKEMVSKYFGNAVQLVAKSDGTYDVIVYFGGTTGYDDAIGDLTYNGQAIKQASNRTYTINVPSLDSAIGLGLHVGGTMNMDITYAMTVDTSTIKLQEGGSEPPVAEVDKTGLQQIVDQAAAMTQGKKSDAAWASLQETLNAARAVLNDANATQTQVNEAATALKDAIDRFNSSQDVLFQVGHTYEVPVAYFKHGSVTETSMAAKYLGDTALVRPQENGTFQVSFAATSEGLGYIKSLSYNGSAIAQSGNQFTLSIPAAESDVVIPIEMAITMMEQLGIGQAQTADMHLYLSQAKDLGTGQASLAASSSNLAQTGDSTTGAATLAVGVAVAGAAAAVAARRRLSQQK